MNARRAAAKDRIVSQLEEARQRTRWLLGAVSDEDLYTQHDPIMSPLIWDYGHIGNYEGLWLLEEAFGKRLSNRNLYDMYNETVLQTLQLMPGEGYRPGNAVELPQES
jgi:gamma-glutamyl hercynylcysteine S-oxide synthase